MVLKRLVEKQQKLDNAQQLIQSFHENSPIITPESQKIDALFSDEIVPAELSAFHEALRFVHNFDNPNPSPEDITYVKSKILYVYRTTQPICKTPDSRTKTLCAHNRRNVKNIWGRKNILALVSYRLGWLNVLLTSSRKSRR